MKHSDVGFGFDFDYDAEKLWELDLPVEKFNIDKLTRLSNHRKLNSKITKYP